jgi:hypothetical protein
MAKQFLCCFCLARSEMTGSDGVRRVARLFIFQLSRLFALRWSGLRIGRSICLVMFSRLLNAGSRHASF